MIMERKFFQFCQGIVSYIAFARAGPVNGLIVDHHHFPVFCKLYIQFDPVCSLLLGQMKSLKRIFRGVPCNLIISDAGGLSVLTAWAAGKLSSTSVATYIKENVEDKVKCRKLVIPGKVAVLKGDIESKLPGWEIIVAPLEAVQLVKFLKDLTA